MLIIKTASAVEKITIIGNVPEHPDVHDFKPWDWSSKPIRPSRVKATFQRVDSGEWAIYSLTIYGFDVLKSGKPSDNINCYRDHGVSRDGEVHRFTSDFDREQIRLTAWARDWAQIELARINEVTQRADLDSDVVLDDAVDLDDLAGAVCVYQGEEYPEHEWKPGDIECRRCGADLSAWNDEDSEVQS